MQSTRSLLAAALAVAFLWAPAPAAPAVPSADKVIARYTKAQGKKAVRRVTSTVLVGAVAGDGAGGRFRQRFSGPDRFEREVEVAGVVVAEGYNGKSAWRRDASGVRTLVDLDAQQARLHALLANARFQELARHRVAARTVGRTVVEGRPASAVEFTFRGARERVFFDDASGLPVKQERTVDGRIEEAFYEDYRRVDGVLEPFSIRLGSSGRTTRVTIERVEHNIPTDESAFRVPAAGAGRPLPDLAALLGAIRANQAKVQELRELYAFRETRTERREGRGAKAGETRVFRVVPVAGRFVRELVSVDGKELSPGDREKERRRTLEQIEEVLDEARERQERAEKAAAKGKEQKEDADGITIATFLRVSEISSVRRETLHGRELLAFDFEPRGDYKPTSMSENVACKLAGTIWVDEAALQVVRLEARLTKKVKIGGGVLASLADGSMVVMEQAKINDEVWLPSYAEIDISGKALLFVKISQSTLSRFSDYERYDVGVDYTGGVPADGPRP